MGIIIPYIGKSFDETCEVMGVGDVFGKLDAGILPSDTPEIPGTAEVQNVK